MTSREPANRKSEEDSESFATMSLIDHLTELRKVLIISLLAVVAGSVIGWFLVPDFLEMAYSSVGTLVYVSPTEAFVTYIKLSIVFGLILSSPVAIWQFWTFVRPGLYPNERQYIKRYGPLGVLLFITGVVFAYYAIYPIALEFFLGVGSESVEPMLSFGRFVSFFVSLILPFGIMFELPLVVSVLVKLRVLNVRMMVHKRKVAYFGAFVLGAMLTPPDIVSQVLMAGPMVLLYELSVIVAKRTRVPDVLDV